MTFADAIPATLAARAAREAERTAARAARDAFIQAQFPLMAARFEALLSEALGMHSRINTVVTTVVLPVQGRSFATLPTRVVQVRSTLTSVTQTVTFTPRLDFREADQFGLIECSIDFDFAPRPTRNDVLATTLTTHGIALTGASVAQLRRHDGLTGSAWTDLTRADLEAAFTAWWLR